MLLLIGIYFTAANFSSAQLFLFRMNGQPYIVNMDEQDFLANVKRVIHSIIVSTPDRVTVESLKQEYADLEGGPLPIRRLGFKDIESFLHSIPDTVELLGRGPMAQLVAKTISKSAHIQNMVQCQKKPIKNSRKRFCYSSGKSNIVFVNEELTWKSMPNNSCKNNNQGSDGHSVTPPSESKQALPRLQSIDETTTITDLVKRLTITNVTDNIRTHTNVAVQENGLRTWFNNACKKYFSADGVSEKDACRTYSINKGASSEFTDFQPKDGKNWNDVYVSSDEGSDSEAIPAFAVDARVLSVEYPKDAVRFDHKLASQNVVMKCNLEEPSKVEIVTVISPCSFTFWFHDEQYEQYETMYHSMQHFYGNLKDNYSIPLFLIMVGHLGACRIVGDTWRRAQVLSVRTGRPENIEVELVDMGDRFWIPHTNLKYLCKKFATLPRQCCRGRLSGIAPVLGPHFSVAASNYFYNLVHGRILYAKINTFNEADNSCTLILLEPDTRKSIDLALIDAGRARPLLAVD